jgi:alginate O-acetyltransferase complex protein AlgI
MLFNSIKFALFLPVVFLLYWFVTRKSLRLQNILLFIASYYFYASWDWRFLFLLLTSTLIDYYTGIRLSSTENKAARKTWLWVSIAINVGLLAVFKYFNFFAESFGEVIGYLGFQVNTWTLKIILPLGISFYTFHGLSYVIDIYKGKIKVERNFINYSVFVSFFPLLVAGPIERATHLLPQIQKERTFDYAKAVDGLKQILWGLFKKVVIADQCAEFADMIFNSPGNYSGGTLLLGAVFFAFQIYGDFSGYSDIALGTARLFGIELLRNFAFPYFSRDIPAFWRRWHISLSSWFRDYVYIPLGGSKDGLFKRIRNTVITFLLSGLWHGANWTFIIWGGLNALYMMPSLIFNKRKKPAIVESSSYLPSLKELSQILITFALTVFAWIFFRSKSLAQALSFIKGIFTASFLPRSEPSFGYIFWLLAFFLVVEWVGRNNQYALENLGNNKRRFYRWAFYLSIGLLVFIYRGKQQPFIYFQF